MKLPFPYLFSCSQPSQLLSLLPLHIYLHHCNTFPTTKVHVLRYSFLQITKDLLHVSEQPQLVILLKTTNVPFQSQMVHTSKAWKQFKIIKRQTSFRTFGKLKCLENSNVLRFIRCMQRFVFKKVQERCRSHLSQQKKTKKENNFH